MSFVLRFFLLNFPHTGSTFHNCGWSIVFAVFNYGFDYSTLFLLSTPNDCFFSSDQDFQSLRGTETYFARDCSGLFFYFNPSLHLFVVVVVVISILAFYPYCCGIYNYRTSS